MYSIEIMVEEHANICRMLKVVRKMCIGILEGEEVCDTDFRDVIDFIRKYADAYHHGKEEKFLFPEMVMKLGKVADNLITHGMLVEHNLGRSYVMALETALNQYKENQITDYKLDIIISAMAYANLLEAHTEKENNAVYTYAERALKDDVKTEIDDECHRFEENEESVLERTKYLEILDKLENRYMKMSSSR